MEKGGRRGNALLGKANPVRHSFPALCLQCQRKVKFKAKSLFTLNLQ